jgi:ABC-type sugar transport system ATPase subunit
MTAPLIAMEGVTKHFGGVQALRGVDFELRAGEIHALLGENGAGKSTLMAILSGVHAPDTGVLKIDGAPVRLASPRDAQAAGIATIFQELDLVPSLDVAANLFLGRELRRPGGFLDNAAMRREARQRLADLELDIDVERLVGDLSIGQSLQIAFLARSIHDEMNRLPIGRNQRVKTGTPGLTVLHHAALTFLLDLQFDGRAVGCGERCLLANVFQRKEGSERTADI